MGTNVALLTGGQGISNVQATGDQFRYQGMDPDDALEQQALNRRQHIANLLIQQGLAGSGTGQMVGRFYVPPSPVQGLADLAKVGVGAYGTYKNDEARSDLASKNQQILADAVKQYMSRTSDVPAVAGSAPAAAPQAVPQESATDTLSRLLPPPGGQPTGPSAGPQAIPNDGRSPTGFTQNFDPNTGGRSVPPATPPIPSYANMSALSGQAIPPQAPTEQQPTGVPPGPTPSAPGRARTPEEKRQALIELMVSQHPQARQLAGFLANQDERVENRQMLHEEKQAGLQSREETNKLLLEQKGEQMKQTLEIGKMQIQALDARGQDTTQARSELQDKELAFKKWQTEQEIAKDKAIAGMKGAKGAGMSATAQKELFEADDTIASSKNVMLSLDRALELNPKAYDGATASSRAKALGYVPGKFVDADATVELDNIVTGQALEQLRATFGGMPTEGERKVLMDIQGSVNMKASQRQAIYERAKEAAKRRLGLTQQKADQLRKGTYFSGEGGVGAEGAPLTTVPTTKGKPNAFQPFHDPDEEKAYQQWKLEHK